MTDKDNKDFLGDGEGPVNPYENDSSHLNEFSQKAPSAPPPPGIYGGNGSYQPPYAAPADNSPVQNRQPLPPPPIPVKTKRVGTFTMALSLIVVGVLLLLRIFIPDMNFVFIFRFFPVILVALGIEILVANARYKEEKIRYDGLSVFFCIILIGGSLVAGTIPDIFRKEIEANRFSQRFSAELVQKSNDLLAQSQVASMATVYWTVDLQSTDFASDTTLATIPPEAYIRLNLEFNKPYTEEEAFVKDAQQVLEKLVPLVPHIDSVIIKTESEDYSNKQEGSSRFILSLKGGNQIAASPEDMLTKVTTEYWIREGDSGHYAGPEQYRSRMEERAVDEVVTAPEESASASQSTPLATSEQPPEESSLPADTGSLSQAAA